ncbi:hypothetical protein [Chelatococcus reniformis]|uniref:Uncharacterized protein n=1 Tax=Chelatococcus reniformis TaxID=1494448 RepID=A0A916UP28_9HYPH|nr:hypothetical protein [Chelatococcus reniformis]GGC81278.1 hypothetical protein GCM10010994_44060 [Chelatococcus reniformis]
MSTLFIIFLVLAAATTALFFAGYARGVRIALASYADDRVEVDDSGDLSTYWWPIALAVLGAAMIIALVGVSPVFIYVAPLLALITAAGNGLAFFIDDDATGAE